jgi:hypothetical protein
LPDILVRGLVPACKGVQWFALLILQRITLKTSISDYCISDYCIATTMIIDNLQLCSNYILIKRMDKLVSSSTPTVYVNAILRRSQTRVWKTLEGEPEFIISVAETQNILGKAAR